MLYVVSYMFAHSSPAILSQLYFLLASVFLFINVFASTSESFLNPKERE